MRISNIHSEFALLPLHFEELLNEISAYNSSNLRLYDKYHEKHNHAYEDKLMQQQEGKL